MNQQIDTLFAIDVAALAADAGSVPLAVVRFSADLAQLYRWRAASRLEHDGRHVIRPTALTPSEPGRWVLVESVSLGGPLAGFVVEAVPLTGDRAVVAAFPGWQLVSVTDGVGGRLAWLARPIGN